MQKERKEKDDYQENLIGKNSEPFGHFKNDERLKVEDLDSLPIDEYNEDNSNVNPFLNRQISPSSMYHHTGDVVKNNIKSFNANNRSSLFCDTKRILDRDSLNKNH